MTKYLNETQRLTIRNKLMAEPDLQAVGVDAALATAISHVLSPVVANMLDEASKYDPHGDQKHRFYEEN